MAVKVIGVPLGAEGAAGVMLTAVRPAAFTVMLALFDTMPFNDAVTVVVPTPTPTAAPVLVLIEATAVLPDTQVTLLVMSAVVESLYVPVATKLVVSPFATELVGGVTEIASSSDEVTVRVALLEMRPLAEAVTVVVPCANVVAMPLALMVATVALLDDQITEPEMLPVLPSE